MITEVVEKEIEKIKGDYKSVINGKNMCGVIDYSTYKEAERRSLRTVLLCAPGCF